MLLVYNKFILIV